MTRLVAFLVIIAVAAGCESFLPEQTLCHNMCDPRAVRSFVAGIGCHPAQCVCDTAQPDGGR